MIHFWITEEKNAVEEHGNMPENQIKEKHVKKIAKGEGKKTEEKRTDEEEYDRREKEIHIGIVVVFLVFVTVSAFLYCFAIFKVLSDEPSLTMIISMSSPPGKRDWIALSIYFAEL